MSGLALAAWLGLVLAPGGAPDLLGLAGLESGPHAVGYRSIRARDASRPWPSAGDPTGALGRPIQISLWYPARDGAGAALSVADYVRADAAPDGDAAAALARARRAFDQGLEAPLDDAQWERALAATGRARAGAEPLPGRRPLLLFETSLGGRSYGFVPLVELLASHGWVAAALASYGHGETERLGFDAAGLAQQVGDMKAALGVLGERPEVDATRVALVGWSVGGVSQALLRLEDPGAFQAAVSLDSGTGYAYGAALLEQAGGVDPARLRVPFLHFDVGRADFEVEKSDAFLRAHRSPPPRRVLLPELRHGDLVLTAGVGRAAALGTAFLPGLDRLAGSLRSFLAEHLPASPRP